MSSLDDPQFATNANYGAGKYSGNPNKERPGAGVIAEGADPFSPWPAEWRNYLDNLFGKWLSSLRDGTVSLNTLTADGVGGNVVSPPASGTILGQFLQAGTTKSTTAFSGTSLPSSTQANGVLGKDTTILAWARYSTIGGVVSLRRAVNIASISRSGVGVSTITPNTVGVSQADMIAVVTSSSGQCTWTWNVSPINLIVNAFSVAGVAAESEIVAIFLSGT